MDVLRELSICLGARKNLFYQDVLHCFVIGVVVGNVGGLLEDHNEELFGKHNTFIYILVALTALSASCADLVIRDPRRLAAPRALGHSLLIFKRCTFQLA